VTDPPVPAGVEVIEGRIRFGHDARAFTSATMVVRIEDTTYADAAAVCVAEALWTGVSFDGDLERTIVFRVERAPAPDRRHTLRVHIDVQGDGRIGPGDYLNSQAVALPAGPVAGIEVRVTRVGP
jgi:hypothetical protein